MSGCYFGDDEAPLHFKPRTRTVWDEKQRKYVSMEESLVASIRRDKEENDARPKADHDNRD